jgi:plasmid replication initiation protein
VQRGYAVQAVARHEREQLELFRALPGDLVPRDAQDLMAYPFFSLAKTHRTTPIDFRMSEIAIRVEAVPGARHGERRRGPPKISEMIRAM